MWCSKWRWGPEELLSLGRGCLFWLVVSVLLSVGLTILLNLGLFAFSG
jgi:hypothetical protein